MVHRVRMPAIKVKYFLAKAESIAQLLGDATSTQSISQLHRTLESVLYDLVLVKHPLAPSMEEQKTEIANIRAQLNKRKELIADKAACKEREHEAAASKVLEKAIDSLGQSPTEATNVGIQQPAARNDPVSSLSIVSSALAPCD